MEKNLQKKFMRVRYIAIIILMIFLIVSLIGVIYNPSKSGFFVIGFNIGVLFVYGLETNLHKERTKLIELLISINRLQTEYINRLQTEYIIKLENPKKKKRGRPKNK